MADTRIQEASWDLINSLRETNQAVANSFVAMQDLNLQFAQSVFLNGVEVLENQTNQTRDLMQVVGQQMQRQQEAYEKLVYATLDIYTNYYRTLFSFYQHMTDAAQAMTQQGVKYTQHATRQAVETATSTLRRGAEQAQQNMHQG